MPTSNARSYNVLINRFRAFCDGHYLLGPDRFSHGQEEKDSTTKEPNYPRMHVFCAGGSLAPGAIQFNFTVKFTDGPKTNESTSDTEKEFLSDSLRLTQDLCAEIKNGELFTYEVDIVNSAANFDFFIDEEEHTLTGNVVTFTIEVPFNWNACVIPASYAPGGGNSSSGPAYGGALTLKTNGVTNPIQSLLDLVEGTNINIEDLGDGRIRISATGGGGGGLTCDDLAACETIIDIVTSISEEATARAQADVNLAAAVTNEGNARQSADTALQTNITNEATTRAGADTTLANNLSSHVANVSNPHSVTKSQVGLSNVPNTDTTTTANITDSSNKRFVTDAQQTVLGNTSGKNSGEYQLNGGIDSTTATGARFTSIAQKRGSASTAVLTRIRITRACTLIQIAGYLEGNMPSDGNMVINVHKNGADEAMSITFALSAVIDNVQVTTSNPVTLAVGDFICYKVTKTGATAGAIFNMNAIFRYD